MSKVKYENIQVAIREKKVMAVGKKIREKCKEHMSKKKIREVKMMTRRKKV